MKKIKLLSLFLSIVFLINICVAMAVQTMATSTQALQTYEDLVSKGFPPTYAEPLSELQLLHPEWTFIPLPISELNNRYTWSYIISQETHNAESNLISSSNSYVAYRHPSNLELYDYGYYQASSEAVSYFMDPRNFLNETDIFQFYSLDYSPIDIGSVQKILKGSFMENITLENGMTYAEYFLQVGKELNISPLFLAVKALQEQGKAGTSQTISGQCGTWLINHYEGSNLEMDQDILQEYNGLYNLFNVNASGNGSYTIFTNAMRRAKTGSQIVGWDNPSWNTIWKSIYGGALILKNNYIDRYQSTPYLQKFNVDPRSVNANGNSLNFYGQYAQNVVDAFSIARQLFTAVVGNDILNSSFTFLIPVFSEMPATPAIDPAHGSCKVTVPAPQRYTYSFAIDSIGTVENTYMLENLGSLEFGSDLILSGQFTHSYGSVGLEYSIDGQPYIPYEITDSNTFSISISSSHMLPGEHSMVIRGLSDFDTDKKQQHNRSVLCACLEFTVLEPPPEPVMIHVISVTGDEILNMFVGDSYSLPTQIGSSDFEKVIGWIYQDETETKILAPQTTLVLDSDFSITAITAGLDFNMIPEVHSATTGIDRFCYETSISYKTIESLNESGLKWIFGVETTYDDNNHTARITTGYSTDYGTLRNTKMCIFKSHMVQTNTFSAKSFIEVFYPDGSSFVFYSPELSYITTD